MSEDSCLWVMWQVWGLTMFLVRLQDLPKFGVPNEQKCNEQTRMSFFCFPLCPSPLYKPAQKTAGRRARGGAPGNARAPGTVGPFPPPRPALSRARADTTRGPRWGLSLRRGRLSRVRGRTLAAGRGGAGPSAAAGSLARVRARKYARMESTRQHRLISLPRMQDGP